MSDTTDEKTDPEPTTADATAADAPTDAREQMRLALERKQNRNAGGQSHADGSSKASAATSNGKVSREFRRKSGG
jgi:hypothetical protein